MAFRETFNQLLETALKENASDLHVTVGRHPTLRVSGTLLPLIKEPLITPDFADAFVSEFLSTPEMRKRFENELELDFSYNFEDRARFRVNIFHQRGFTAAALRYIPTHIRDFTELGLPTDVFARMLSHNQGFILVVGPTGQGKTTTLAAMINYINTNFQWNIVTIEDPIEYLFTSDRSTINQREIGADTGSFARALRSMFRQDVNTVMIGEMRDPETIATALTAAETGHLIISSLHTNNASQTIDRIIDAFPASQQIQVRAQLAGSLIGIVSQRLVNRLDGGLVPALEVMFVNSAIKNLIRENKIYEIDLMIEMESQEGMMSLNRSLASLVKQGQISLESAFSYSLNPNELKTLIR